MLEHGSPLKATGWMGRKARRSPLPDPAVRAHTSLLAASLLALVGLPACFLFGGGQRTNILLVVVDSLRYDAISRARGAASTPHMQQLITEGAAFRSCFSHSPDSQPALAALLSSRLPHENGLMSNGNELGDGVALLPEWLTKRGYRTFAALGLANCKATHPGRALDRGFSKLVTFPHDLAGADEVVDSFSAFLGEAPADEPWFGLLQLTETRQPFDAAEDERVEAQLARDGEDPETLSIGSDGYWERSTTLPPGRTRFTIRADVALRVLRFEGRAGKRNLTTRFESGKPFVPGTSFVISVENPDGEPVDCTLVGWFHDAPTLAESRKRYRREIEEVDRAVGRLVDELHARNQYDHTLIVLTSDHGLALGEHEHLGRGSGLYDEFLHVPLLIKPVKDDGRVELLRQSLADVTRLIDVVPTLLELADLSAMPGADGISLLEHRRRELFAESHPDATGASSFAVRDERFKLVLDAAANRFQMYDLRSDTLEQEDVFPLQGQNKPDWQRRLGALVGSVHALDAQRQEVRFEALGY
jgi:arylsulfatase A-like enzyme